MDERTKEILRLFNLSWTETESTFDELINNHLGFERLTPLISFIQKLKNEGENNHFRIGTSMHILMFSRSVKFGLRADQKFITIEMISDKDIEVTFRDGRTIFRKYRINSFDDPRISKSLKALKDTLVD